MAKPWFEVDRVGLRKTLARRGKQFAVFELLQNAFDENVLDVELRLTYDAGKVLLEVIDDSPDGFRDLREAYTLYAESRKKTNPEQRGAFNIGDKFVLALCSWAKIVSTTGGVEFDDNGRHSLRTRTEKGTRFMGTFRATRDEFVEIEAACERVIAPTGVNLTISGVPAKRPKLVTEFRVTLPTMIANDEGIMRPTQRETSVRLYDAEGGGWLYEMGIPVVEIGDRWHVNVAQKVPLNMERDNVTPSYLQAVRVAVLNATAKLLTKEDATANWVREAASDYRASDDAVTKVVDLRFGEKRVAYDPSDPEANALAVTKGYTVVHGGSLSSGEWQNAKRSAAILPAGQVTPSPKPFSPDGKPLRYLDNWTAQMREFQRTAERVHRIVCKGEDLTVRIANDSDWNCTACYGQCELTVNLGRVGYKFFESDNLEAQLALLIHEFAHYYESNHLSEKYYDACCSIGAKLACAEPSTFV